MGEKRVVLEIFDHSNVNKVPIKRGMWRYAFIRDEDGKVVFAEVINMSKGKNAWCYAGADTVDKKTFDRINSEDPLYYDSMTFEHLMTWAFKGCFKVENVNEKKTTKKKTTSKKKKAKK